MRDVLCWIRFLHLCSIGRKETLYFYSWQCFLAERNPAVSAADPGGRTCEYSSKSGSSHVSTLSPEFEMKMCPVGTKGGIRFISLPFGPKTVWWLLSFVCLEWALWNRNSVFRNVFSFEHAFRPIQMHQCILCVTDYESVLSVLMRKVTIISSDSCKLNTTLRLWVSC